MEYHEIERFDPCAFFRGDNWFQDGQRLTQDVQRKFKTFYKHVELSGAHSYDLDRIATGIFYIRPLLERHSLTGPDKVAVEIGCGTGNKSLSINDLFGQYIGIDLLEDQTRTATERAAFLGENNTRFIYGNAANVLRQRADFGLPAKVDVLVLYAVVEHLTHDERSEILRLADSVMAEGGQVLLMESPNRLIPFDAHTTGMHFFNFLPDRLASEVAKAGMKRREMAAKMLPWSDPEASTQLARYGRGVSFHDLEMNLRHPLESYSFVADSFEPESLNMEPSTYREISLLGYISANLPEVPATAFSRSWLDFIVARGGKPARKKLYLSPHWPNWLTLASPPAFWDPIAKRLGGHDAQWRAAPAIPLAHDITLSLQALGTGGKFSVIINGDKVDDVDIAELRASRPRRWHEGYSIAYKLDKPLMEIRVEADGASEDFLFLGCFVSIPRTPA
jgi:SAM-dependent methyltransferase